MAKINPSSFIRSLSGKMSNSEHIVYRTRNGKTSAYVLHPSKVQPSEAQMRYRAKFKHAAAMAKAEVAVPEGLAKWQAAADESGGRYATPYAAALAFYIKDDSL